MVINNWRPSGCNSLEALTAQVNPMRLRVEELLHLSHQYLPGGKFDLGIGDRSFAEIKVRQVLEPPKVHKACIGEPRTFCSVRG